jgi:hypothetical protein
LHPFRQSPGGQNRFGKRDLSEHNVVQLLVDGIAELQPPGKRREARGETSD